MVGDDKWLLEKPKPGAPPITGPPKKSNGKRRKSTTTGDEEPPLKRRRQTWLGEEVAAVVRRMRTSFFSCSLIKPRCPSPLEAERVAKFEFYSSGFDAGVVSTDSVDSTIADVRHALLEFCQFRNLEFDTLRRAKYSTSVLLYHLHIQEADGLVPSCTCCKQTISDVRWHKISRVAERRQPKLSVTSRRKGSAPKTFVPEECCSTCFEKRPDQDLFIPLQVSIRRV